MIVRFWGTRGSLPAPIRPAEIEDKIAQAISGLARAQVDPSNPEAVRAYVNALPPLQRGTAGGNTPCVEVHAGGETLILDAGSGLRELGWELMKGPCSQGRGTLHLLITHPHWDHIQGFPMFQPAFVPGNRIMIYGVHDLRTAFEAQQHPHFWPVSLSHMPADIEFISLEAGDPFSVGRVRINTIQSTHPGMSYSYRIEDQHCILVYASDAEYKHLDEASLQPYIEFFRNADAVIFDAQYTLRDAWTKVDWGHSSAMIGVDMARAAGAKKMVIFHHDPTYSDAELERMRSTVMEYQAQDWSRPICEVSVAYEGLTLNLTPLGAVDLQLTADGEAAILTPLHTFDRYGVDQLAQYLAHIEEHTPSSIVDLSQVDTLSTTGLKSLVMLRQERESTPIVLVAPSENVRQVIELSGYLDYFAIYPSVETALAADQAREALNLPGQLVQGRYLIEGKLEERPLGTLLKATDTHTNRAVTLKILSPTFSQDTVERLMRQSPQLLALDHRNIVSVLDCSRDGDHVFLVEEFVGGPPLQLLLEGRREPDSPPPLPPEDAMEIAMDLIRALEYAHSHGVLHGDLKPQHIILTDDGAKVAGFGLGHLEEGRDLLDVPLLLLSAPYLAPEQILGQALDTRTDLYSLGVILYQLFTGRLPFEGTDQEIMRAHLHQEPAPPRESSPHLSPSLEHLILRLLAKNPNERYASASQARRVSTHLLVGAEEVVGQSHTLLVGREEQVAALQSCWKEARAGRGQLCSITGEAGIGKTSLALQIAAQCEAPVRLIGRCEERTESPAYHLFAQVLRSYFSTIPPELFDEQARQLCANFTRLVPEIRRMIPDLPESAPLEPEQEQLRLMSSLTRFVRRATRERPWLLVLDDLQWADSSSLELLRHLGRYVPSMAILIIGTYRDTELEPEHPLQDTLRNLSRHPTCRSFPLERLTEEHVGQILSHIWQQPVPDDLTHKIYQQTEGNPFFVEEVAKGLEDDGLVFLQEGRWHFPSPGDVRLPQSVREAVWRRIGHLSPDTQALLSQAAILGVTFRFDDLRQMSSLSEWQVLERLDIALERHLIQEVPGDTTLLRFHHAETQQVLYTDLGPLRRRMLHRQAGEVLERRARQTSSAPVAELAYHFGEAAEFERALEYSLQAARQAQSAHANQVALSWYQRVLEILEQLSPLRAAPYHSLQVAAHQGLGELLTLVSEYEEALPHLIAAQELLSDLPPSESKARQLADLSRQMAQVYEKRGQYDHALEWIEKGLQYLDKDMSAPERARLYNLAGWVRRHLGEYEAAQSWFERALELARGTGLRQVEADSLRRIGAVAYYFGDYDRYEACSEQALQIYREIGDRCGEGAILNNYGIFFATQGEHDKARAFQEQALLIWREVGDRWSEGAVLNNLGGLSNVIGDLDSARTYFEQSLLICREIGDRRGEGRALSSLGVVADGQGDYAAAKDHFQAALRIRQEIGDRRGEGETLNDMGNLARSLGNFGQAKALYEQALQIHREISDRLGETLELSNLSLLFHQMGDSQRAMDYGQQTLALAEHLGDRHFLGYAWTHLGHALLGVGKLDEAAAAYRRSLDLRRQGMQHNVATETLAGLARVAAAQGETDRAGAYVEEILRYLEIGSLDGTEEPFRVYLTCYQVLEALQDPRARQLLARAHTLLHDRAGRIEDEGERRSFLEEIPAHRDLASAFTHRE